MDIATHALVPMAGALAALGFLRRDAIEDRRRAAIATVFGIAGFAPDLDGLIDGLSARSDALYFLQHRGLSHTLVGAPLFGLVALGALVLLARAWPRRMSLFTWRPVLVPAAILGSLTHLVLDGVTYSGVPLLWPFSFARVGFPLFHWLVWWLFPVGALVLALHAVGRLSRRRVVQAGALVVVALLVVASVRVVTRPSAADLPEGALVFPASSELAWTIATPIPDGSWRVETYRDGRLQDPVEFFHRAPEEAAEAIARVTETGAFKGFRMGSFGPVVTQAHREGEAWNVTFLDVAQRYEALHDPRWTPAEPFEDWGYVTFLVRGEEIDVVHRGW